VERKRFLQRCTPAMDPLIRGEAAEGEAASAQPGMQCHLPASHRTQPQASILFSKEPFSGLGIIVSLSP
jgi:hypothetical protein